MAKDTMTEARNVGSCVMRLKMSFVWLLICEFTRSEQFL